MSAHPGTVLYGALVTRAPAMIPQPPPHERRDRVQCYCRNDGEPPTAIELVWSSVSDGIQPRQMISFLLNLSSAARLIPSRAAVHSCEYGFSLESSSSLGELSLETTSSLVFRTFTGFTWLRFGRGPSPSQFASAVVGGWM